MDNRDKLKNLIESETIIGAEFNGYDLILIFGNGKKAEIQAGSFYDMSILEVQITQL